MANNLTTLQENLIFKVENNDFCWKELILASLQLVEEELVQATKDNQDNIGWAKIGYPSFVDMNKAKEDKVKIEELTKLLNSIEKLWNIYKEFDIDIYGEDISYVKKDLSEIEEDEECDSSSDIEPINTKEVKKMDNPIITKEDKELIHTIKHSQDRLKICYECLNNLYWRLYQIEKQGNLYISFAKDIDTYKGDLRYFIGRIDMVVNEVMYNYWHTSRRELNNGN